MPAIRTFSPVLLVVAAVFLQPVPADAAQRSYAIRSATTTITFDNGWLGALQSAGVEISAGAGAHLTVIKPKDAAPIVRARFSLRTPKRTESSNLLVYGTSQGTLLTVNHAGSLTLRSTETPGAVTFQRPVAVLAAPPISTGANRFDALLARRQPRGTEPFIRVGRIGIPQPHGGRVEIHMNNVVFDSGSGLLNGTDPESPAGSADWFPSAGRGVMGDVVMVLRVKRMR